MHKLLVEYIRNIIEVSDKELKIICSRFHLLKSSKGDLLITEGQTNQRMFFIIKGCLRVYFSKEDGQETTRYLAFENQFATALVSFITGEPSLEFIETGEESELLYISKYDFSYLLKTIPQWEVFYRTYLEVAYVNNTNRLMSFITLDATERYKLLLAQSPIIVRRLPNKMVANYLNISQETLSRLKANI